MSIDRLFDDTGFLRGLFEQAPSFMAVLRGPRHVFQLANAAYLRLIGGRDVIGMSVADGLPEVTNQGFLTLLDKVYTTGEPYVGRNVKVTLEVEAGRLEERLIDFVYQPIRNGTGAVEGIFVEGVDVTEQALAAERLRIAQEAGGIGTFEWFPSTGRVIASDEYRRIWGIGSDVEITDMMLVGLVLEEDRPRTGPRRAKRIDNPLQYVEYRVRRPSDGQVRWLARQGEVIKGQGGLESRYLGVTFDVTQRVETEQALLSANERLRASEAALLALNDTLEHRVADEVAERSRTEEALRQAQKMEAVGQLTGGIAHDFNNLLQGIVGSLELMRTLMARGRASEIDRFVTSAMASAHRAAALTHRLLAFSRRQPLDPKPVDVNRLVASIEDLLRRSLGAGIHTQLVLAGAIWITKCDCNQLENAILNLAINARDAMPHGGTLTIETHNETVEHDVGVAQSEVATGQYVCIAVTDTGTGMSPDVASRAFDPFFTTKPTGQGTGLGLSMIYGFARQSEGYARIDSELGRGTTVRLYLPRFDGESELDAPSSSAGQVFVSQDRELVLVVEDEAVVRSLVVEVLHELGYRTIEASDGPQALRILDSQTAVDLLVTDIGLPGLNGRQVADAARVTRPELKVLLMTGYAENAAMASGFLAPGMSLITKPFSMDAMAARVREMLEGNAP